MARLITTSMNAANTYDLVPYRSNPRRMTHPDTAATLARLMGLQPAPVDACQVLEIGCGTGGNVLATAWSLPNSQFLGIDPSAVQIGIARSEADRFEIRNVRYEVQGAGDLLEDGEPFDYIFCHGVYSWVPPAVQDQILAACRRRLAPHGVAMISYNTYPGWHFRGIGREAMNFITRDIADPLEKVREARGYLQFLKDSAVEKDSIYARALAEELEVVSDRHDYYVFHEHLEEYNSPCYFHEFNARAKRHGLQYLGEAGRHWFLTGLTEETQKVLQGISRDLIELEQHIDFVRNRTFRHTLLVRDDATIIRRASPTVLNGLRARSTPETKPLQEPTRLDERTTYRSLDDVTVTTASPFMNAVLLELIDRWPCAAPLEELKTAVVRRIVAEMPEESDKAATKFPQAVFDWNRTGFISLHTWQPYYVASVSERPHAWRLARHLATDSGVLPSLTHQAVRLSPIECAVLVQCDGTREISAIASELEKAIASGSLPPQDGDLTDLVRASLARIVRCALLIE